VNVVVGCALVLAVVAGVRGMWSPCGLSMLSAINPMSEAGRGHRYWLTCSWFVVGSVAGGLGLGAVTALAAWPLGGTALAALGAVAALVTLASDLRLGGFALPVHPRQVDETWFGAYRRWVYAAGFGAQIGVGFATYVMTSATNLMAALAVLGGSPGWALAVGGVFGVVRGLAVLLSVRARSPQQLRLLHQRLALIDPWSMRASMVSQAVVALVLAVTVAGTAGGLAALAVVLLLSVPPFTKKTPSPA
jgi:hypothetical protein